MAIEVKGQRVFTPISTDASVTATRAQATGQANVPSVSTSATQTPAPFHVLQEWFGDGGAGATNHFTDLGIDAAGFRANLSSGETSYYNAHHDVVMYIALPHDILSPATDSWLLTNYPDSTDVNYRTTMQNLASSYGIENTFMFACPEWDNDPGNNGWAANRFLEAGVGGSRPDVPSGLTRQQAYDQWIHFYLANHHGGNTNHQQLTQLLGVPYITRGYKIQCNNAFAGSCFYSYEMGIDQVTLQRNNDDIGSIVGASGFIRGAATQYGKQWGWDTSQYRGHWGSSPFVVAYSGTTRTGGWSNAVYKRTRHMEYATGAHIIMEEAAVWTGTATTINGRGYNPAGVELRDFCNYALTRHPPTQRGIPHVPIAVMKDHNSFFEPRYGMFNQGRGAWYLQMSANGGENMLYNFMDMAYPGYNAWGSSTAMNVEPMGTGRWGEQFDMLTERVSAQVMSRYRVIMLSTNAVMDSTLQAKLNTYVQAGGILVINARQLTGTAHQALTGITVTGTASTSGTVTWEPDATTTSESTFNYTTITLGTATRIARTGASTPQVTRNLVGLGEVWVTLPDYMSNTANNAMLNVSGKLIDQFIVRFAVVTISGGNHANIDYCINKQAGASGAANTITIMNSNDPGGATWTGTVSFPQGTPIREWIADVTPSSSNAAGRTNISGSVPAGDVKVYAVG